MGHLALANRGQLTAFTDGVDYVVEGLYVFLLEEFRHLFLFFRFMANAMAGNTPDRRDWGAIRTWAEGLHTELAV